MKKKKIQSRISGSSGAACTGGSESVEGDGKSPQDSDDETECSESAAPQLQNTPQQLHQASHQDSPLPPYLPPPGASHFSDYLQRPPMHHPGSNFGMLPHPSEIMRDMSTTPGYPDMYNPQSTYPLQNFGPPQPSAWFNPENTHGSENSSPSMAGLLNGGGSGAGEPSSCLSQLGSPPKPPVLSSLFEQTSTVASTSTTTTTLSAFEPLPPAPSLHAPTGLSAYFGNGYSQPFYDSPYQHQHVPAPPMPQSSGYFPPVPTTYGEEMGQYNGYEPYTSMFAPQGQQQQSQQLGTPTPPPPQANNGLQPFQAGPPGEPSVKIA